MLNLRQLLFQSLADLLLKKHLLLSMLKTLILAPKLFILFYLNFYMLYIYFGLFYFYIFVYDILHQVQAQNLTI